MSNAPSKIHLVTRSYLAAWSSDAGELVVRDVRYGTTKRKSPAGVGWRPAWWGSESPKLNQACEEACNKLETTVPPLLSDLEQRWPLRGNDRAVLAQFLALHVLRTPAFTKWFDETRERSLAELAANWTSRLPFAEFAAAMRSDGERARKLIELTNKLSSVFASMHWSLIDFDEPVLATSDQPVCGMPLPDGRRLRPISATVNDGWTNSMEFRFALNPYRLLVGCWHDAPEVGPGWGHWLHAVDHNVAVSSQADWQWFHHPTRQPAMPLRVVARPSGHQCESIAQAVVPGYSADSARVSDRRQRALDEVNRLIRDQDNHTVSFVSVESSLAA